MTNSDVLEPDRRLKCQSCNNTTLHKVISVHEIGGVDEANDYRWWDEFRIVQCKGCEAVCFEKTSKNTEDFDRDGSLYETRAVYPKPDHERRSSLVGRYLPSKVDGIFEQTLQCFAMGSYLLTAIGLRSVVEAACQDLNCQSKNLQKRIDELAELGYLSAKQAEFLHLTRFMGNAAAHEIAEPSVFEVTAVLEIVETLLRTIYELPKLAKLLGA